MRDPRFHLSFPVLTLLIATAHFLSVGVLGIPILSPMSSIPSRFSSQKSSLLITLRQTSTAPISLSFSLRFMTPRYTTLSELNCLESDIFVIIESIFAYLDIDILQIH